MNTSLRHFEMQMTLELSAFSDFQRSKSSRNFRRMTTKSNSSITLQMKRASRKISYSRLIYTFSLNINTSIRQQISESNTTCHDSRTDTNSLRNNTHVDAHASEN